MLQQKGYRAACIGKWHLGFDWSAIRKSNAEQVSVGKKKTWPADAFDWSKPIPGGPLDHGFDYYFGDDVPNFPPYTWIENDRVKQAPTVPYVPDPRPTEGAPEGRPGPMVVGWKQDAVMPTLTKRAVEWIGEQKGSRKPFFLYWPWTSPHAPIVPTTAWQGKTKAGGYGDFVAQSDHHAGQVLSALDENGFRDNTIVIFTADNGPERYAYERIRNHGHRSSGPLRGLKRDIWEGGHRVPFVVRWPGVVQAGAVTDGLMSQIDIMATLAAIVGFELPADAADDSHNQLALWKGGESARTSIVHNTKPDHYAIRKDNWVLIDAPSGNVSSVPAWLVEASGYQKNPHPAALFDLRSDISQHENLFADQSQRVKELQELLIQTRETGEVR
jgi:arylsulfatase A